MPRTRPKMPKPPKRRYAICVDEAGTPLMRNAIYRILYDDVREREGLLCVSDEVDDSYDYYEAERFLFVRYGKRSDPRRGCRILADALEREARLLERGLEKRIGESYAPALKRIVAVDSSSSQAVSFALGFWDELVDAARSGWRTYGGFRRADWILFTRRVAREVRRGREAVDLPLLEYVEGESVPKRPKWFRGVYGRHGRLDEPIKAPRGRRGSRRNRRSSRTAS